MTGSTKKKLAIFAGTSKCLTYAEAKYCASEMPGEIKYYECSRTEYCCAFGCCVSPGLHFHHLWYYWILVIIMFLVCSGGGWWYRYWLQGRYRAAASAIPTRSSSTRTQNSLRNTSCQAQQARITYNSARNTVLLHRMWKGPQRNIPAPAYNGSNATTSTHYQNMNVILDDTNCPYYQLYGPPPSYETVIAQTRGKISNPASPESSTAQLNLPATDVIPNPSVPQCFFYTCNSPSRFIDNGNSNRCPSANAIRFNSLIDNHETIPFAHFSQCCTTNDAIGPSVCVPLNYPDGTVSYEGSSHNYQGSPKRLPDYTSNAENVAHGYEVQSINAMSSSCREQQCPWNDQSMLKVYDNIAMQDENPVSWQEYITEMHGLASNSNEDGSNDNNLRHTSSTDNEIQRNFPRERSDYGGSLRLPRRCTDDVLHHDNNFQTISADLRNSQRTAFDSTTCQTVTFESESSNVSRSERVADVSNASSSQSNPSNNVILESFIFENMPPSSENVEEVRSLHAMNRSTNFDLESKHKLDRSKSLD